MTIWETTALGPLNSVIPVKIESQQLLNNVIHSTLFWMHITNNNSQHFSGHGKLRPFCELFLKLGVLHIMIF